jgi:hypothetical protein
MNNYLSPEDAPWTEEYRDAQRVIYAHLPMWFEDDGDLLAYESPDVI